MNNIINPSSFNQKQIDNFVNTMLRNEEKKSFSLLAESTKEVLDKYHIIYE